MVLDAPNYTFYLIEINKFRRPQFFIVVDPTLISSWLRNFDLIDEYIDERISLNVMYRGVTIQLACTAILDKSSIPGYKLPND
jgi:hypothetical protein